MRPIHEYDVVMARWLVLLIAAMASLPDATVSRGWPPYSRAPVKFCVPGIVVYDEHAKLREFLGTIFPVPVAEPTAEPDVEIEGAADAGSLSSQMRPPLNSTSRRQMVRPRPVRRACGWWKCRPDVNGWNNFAARSLVMPMPSRARRT